MGEQAALEAYESLLAWLRQNNLEWVAEQVQDEITLGRIKSERITVEKPEDTDKLPVSLEVVGSPRKLPGRSSAEFLSRVEYSPHEKFEIAIGAVEAVVSGAVKIEDSILKLIGSSSAKVDFVPGEIGNSAHHIQRSDLAIRREHVILLEHYFRLLREDVKNAD